MRNSFTELDPIHAIHLPLSERVLDRLGDMLLAGEDILDMISDGRGFESEPVRSVESSLRSVYDQINELMKQMAD